MTARRATAWGWSVLVAWSLPALVGGALWSGWLTVRDRWNPWAPLWPQEAPNALTAYKLRRLANDPLACEMSLRATRLAFTPVADRKPAAGCGWTDAVRVEALPARVGTPTEVCTYGDSAGGGRSDEGSGRRSEHASANALDVAAFTLADGTTVNVARDWRRGASDARGRFLREVHDGACALWSVVLGPEYNAAHRDHFHLDVGAARACR